MIREVFSITTSRFQSLSLHHCMAGAIVSSKTTGSQIAPITSCRHDCDVLISVHQNKCQYSWIDLRSA